MPTPRKPKPVHPSIYNAEKAIQRAHKAIHTNTLLYPPTFQSITLNNNNNNNNNILKLNQLSSIPLHVQHQPSIQTIKKTKQGQQYSSIPSARILSPKQSPTTTTGTTSTPNSYAKKRLQHYKLRNLRNPIYYHEQIIPSSPLDRLKSPQTSIKINTTSNNNHMDGIPRMSIHPTNTTTTTGIVAKSPKRIHEKRNNNNNNNIIITQQEQQQQTNENELLYNKMISNINTPFHFINRDNNNNNINKLTNHETIHVINIVNDDLNQSFHMEDDEYHDQDTKKTILSPQQRVEAISPKRIRNKRRQGGDDNNNNNFNNNKNIMDKHIHSPLIKYNTKVRNHDLKIQPQEPYIIIHPSSSSPINQRLVPPRKLYETKTIKYNKKVLGIYKRCEEKPTSKLTRDNRNRKTQPTPLVRMLKGDHRLSYVKEIVKSAKERRGMEHLE